ncbi:addiction module antidote protein, HigA family [bacterium B13(2017)]|nr:addiction module antidote protein, HigA family [bacterium B13(2017)]
MKSKKILDPIHPGEILLEEFMKPMGVSINRLAREIIVPPGRISEIVNGKRSITADTALRLGKYFGISPEIWIDLQSDYDLKVVRNTTWPKIESRIHEFHAA